MTFHQSLLTLDTHVDTPLRVKHEGVDLGKRHDPRLIYSKLDFPRMEEGGLDAAFFAVWTPQGARTDSGHAAIKQNALEIIGAVESNIATYPDLAAMAYNSNDAKRLRDEGKYAIYLGMENGYPLGTELENLDLFYERGVRYITLCHTSNNEICDSSNDSTEFGGLSPFGYTVVKRMNQLGMMVDVSHLSDASVEDVLACSEAPVIASHSCAKALCDNPRNINDNLLRQIAKNGGVVQVNLFSEYIKIPTPNPGRDSAQAALKEKWGDKYKLNADQKDAYQLENLEVNRLYPRFLPTVADLVDHIDHIVKIAGIDHIGIGSDFDGGAELEDCYDVSEMPNITQELIHREYSKAAIEKIWSGNLLRLFHEVEMIADSSKTE
ncbi:membrane dipeptidase [bacterium]|nr:membrane dipeptidase [bacterium]